MTNARAAVLLTEESEPQLVDVEVRHLDGSATVVLRGELDLTGVDLVRAEARPLLARYDAGQITLDCRGLSFIDGAGLTLLEGLADFITVTDAEIADAMRMLLRTTHTMVEPAGAAGLAGLRKLAPTLEGKRVGIVLSGANVDSSTLRRVLAGEL